MSGPNLGVSRYVSMTADEAVLAISLGVPMGDAIRAAVRQALQDQAEATDIALRILSRQSGDKAGARWYDRHGEMVRRIRPSAGLGSEVPMPLPINVYFESIAPGGAY